MAEGFLTSRRLRITGDFMAIIGYIALHVYLGILTALWRDRADFSGNTFKATD